MAQNLYGGPNSDPRRRYFCDLCQKGYARQEDLNSHENDYDHQHRKREKDRKALSRPSAAIAKAKAADQRRANEESGMKTIKLSGQLGGPSKKPPVVTPVVQPQAIVTPTDSDPSGAVRNGWDKDRYDPMIITACDASCPVCQGKDEAIRL